MAAKPITLPYVENNVTLGNISIDIVPWPDTEEQKVLRQNQIDQEIKTRQKIYTEDLKYIRNRYIHAIKLGNTSFHIFSGDLSHIWKNRNSNDFQNLKNILKQEFNIDLSEELKNMNYIFEILDNTTTNSTQNNTTTNSSTQNTNTEQK